MRCSTSGRLTPAARTSIRISPSRSSGRSRFSGFSTNGPPGSEIAIAVILAGSVPGFAIVLASMVADKAFASRGWSYVFCRQDHATGRPGEWRSSTTNPTKPVRVHAVGEDLSRLSAGELAERIGQLKAEIARLEAELSTKGATKAAAEALFKRG